MKWTRKELEQIGSPITFDEDAVVEDSEFAGTVLIHGVKDVHVSGTGWLMDEEDRFACDMQISCKMICPDSITGEDLEIPLETESQEVYSFVDTDEEDVRVVKDEVIDLLPAVIDAIMLEVPISVTDADESEYPSGDGWVVMSEAEYQESRKDQIDPRLAKMKEFKNE